MNDIDTFLKTELETLVDMYGFLKVSAALGEIEEDLEAELNGDSIASNDAAQVVGTKVE